MMGKDLSSKSTKKVKSKKLLSFEEAIDEILDDFRLYSEQIDLFARIYSLLAGGQAVVGEEKCPPFGIKTPGIWYQPGSLVKRKFYSVRDFPELLKQAFISNKPDAEEICKIYSMVMDVEAHVSPGHSGDVGIWVETEMKDFMCIQCGHCCLHLPDSYSTSAFEEDIIRWKKEKRLDILKYIVAGDLWINPRTNEDFDQDIVDWYLSEAKRLESQK